jgi:spore maturation protein CgeB
VPACGGFLLSDPRPELLDLFGEHAATYRASDPDDLARQVRYWLAHPDRREAAARGQHEAVQGHSYADRARVLLETLAEL